MTDLRSNPLTLAERVRIHATAWAILGDPHAAEDVVQDLALRLESGCPEPDGPRRESWIARQAIGLSKNHRRGRRRRARRELEAGLSRARRRSDPPDGLLVRQEDHARLRSALADLEENQRLPLVLRYFHDRRLAEIAEILDVPVSTAHERLRRGLRRLRGRLGDADLVPALIGLSVPRAALVLGPTTLLARISMVAGGTWGVARAALLLAAASLLPQAVHSVAEPPPSEVLVAAAPPRFSDPPPSEGLGERPERPRGRGERSDRGPHIPGPRRDSDDAGADPPQVTGVEEGTEGPRFGSRAPFSAPPERGSTPDAQTQSLPSGMKEGVAGATNLPRLAGSSSQGGRGSRESPFAEEGDGPKTGQSHSGSFGGGSGGDPGAEAMAPGGFGGGGGALGGGGTLTGGGALEAGLNPAAAAALLDPDTRGAELLIRLDRPGESAAPSLLVLPLDLLPRPARLLLWNWIVTKGVRAWLRLPSSRPDSVPSPPALSPSPGPRNGLRPPGSTGGRSPLASFSQLARGSDPVRVSGQVLRGMGS